ncbi:alpha/beta fold hydrolase [Profundibacterium mesophilum]|uniref:Haloalkane dehalogenase n=1 Tax=Profundibacterium mesophilum KAUST100406-0324 TaxID=1037889 RepID=A0A921NWM5_9RHOB|nr:alpha/beta hydrolase [Profundibacterium mesophilum]KAF0677028.1 haloalkane dehalogenase [Profundibacterium mesophilum KAUST100406-0324]
MQSHNANVDGIEMRWEESGSGDPLVLLHGIPTCPALWRDVAPLIKGRRVLAWEMPGYGASIPAGEDRDISIAKQADYLAAWMDSQGIEKAVVAAHDLGGGVAQNLAVRHPRLISGLLLTNAIGYDSWPIPMISAIAKTGSIARHAPDGSFRKFLKMMMEKGHETEAAAEAAYDAHAPHYDAHGDAEAFVRQARSLDVNDTTSIQDKLPSLNIPARIVWGTGDEFQTIDYGERFAKDLRAPLRRIEGGLHFTPEDHPQIIADEINALIETVNAA